MNMKKLIVASGLVVVSLVHASAPIAISPPSSHGGGESSMHKPGPMPHAPVNNPMEHKPVSPGVQSPSEMHKPPMGNSPSGGHSPAMGAQMNMSPSMNHSSAPGKEGHAVTSGINFKEEDKKAEEDVVHTVDVDSGGNWLLKRVWWEKTEEVYGQVKDAFNKVMTSRMNFFSKRNELDTFLDQSYQNLGMEQVQIQEVLDFGLQVIEKEKKDQGFLSKKERAFSDKIKDKQRTFEQLKKDADAVEALDKKIDDALDVVLKQIDICNKYEQQAWENFKNIARELNDKEARKLYYETQGLLKDVEDVDSYLTGPFLQYFSQTLQAAEDHMKSILAQMATLKTAGIDLKKEAEIIEKDDEQLELEEHAKRHKEEAEKAAAQQKKKPKASQGFFAKVTSWFSGIARSIGSLTKIFGSKKSVPKVKVPTQETPSKPVKEASSQPVEKKEKVSQKEPKVQATT